MSFTSVGFVVAFAVFCAVYFAVPARHQQALLLLGSLGACAMAGAASLAWLIAITLLGYVLGRSIARSRSSARLAASIALAVAPLMFLKYTNFALTSFRDAAEWTGIGVFAIPYFDVAVPVGISFYTFVVIGYLVDVYLERVEPERHLGRFTLLTAFFPKFVAGPVERATTFLPQLDSAKRFDYARVTDGMRLMGWGLFKKLVVADRLGIVVDAVYAAPEEHRGLVLFVAAIFYMFQIYYDFSGYTDMALGAAKILGYDLTPNFNRPYAARSVSDFWRRWHISLTSWFFDYIFWPIVAALRGRGKAALVVAIVTTFLLSGLWHGAQWTFLLYGFMHAVAMCTEYLTAKPRKSLQQRIPLRLYGVMGWLATFAFLMFAFIVFRAESVAQAWMIACNMLAGIVPDLAVLVSANFSPSAVNTLFVTLPADPIKLAGAIAIMEIISWLGVRKPVRERLLELPVGLRWAVYYGIAGAIVFYGAHNAATTFIYMQF